MANNSTLNPGTSLGILDLTLPHSRLMFLCDSILVGRTKVECDDIALSNLQDGFAYWMVRLND